MALPVVRLLPRYDAYLLGYRSRDLLLDDRYVKRVYPGGGLLHPALLADGRIGGTWKTRLQGEQAQVLIEPFADLAADVRPVLQEEVEEVPRFLSGAATRH